MIYYIFFTTLIAGALFCTWKISVIDFRRRIIPDAYLFPLLIIGLVITTGFPWICTPYDGAIGAAFGYAMTMLIGIAFSRLTPRDQPIPPIGMGDVKLIATGGLWLGPTGLATALVISCILGIIWGKVRHQKYIPFAPFFACGGILALITMWILI